MTPKPKLPQLPSFLQQLQAGFFSEETYNKMAYYIFYFGYITQMFPIERPVREDLGEFGQVAVIHHRHNPYRKFFRGLGVFGLVSFAAFEILQMVRFVPYEGFTLRVVYVIYYFALTLLSSLVAFVNFNNEKVMIYGWDRIEANTKLCQRYGACDAAKWKYSPTALLIALPVTVGVSVLAVGMTILFAFKPNIPAHLFYLLPEKWKPYTAAYLAAVVWQIFLILKALTAINMMVVIAIAFVFGTKTVTMEAATSDKLTIPQKIRIFRAVEVVNVMANEYAKNLFLPVLSFCTIATGVTFTYIALTRYGDPQLGLAVYCAVVFIDVLMVVAVSLIYIQAGKYSVASAELIESIRTALKDKRALEDPKLQYFRKQLVSLRQFDLKVGSYAKANVETTKKLHETIVDYLMLMLEL